MFPKKASKGSVLKAIRIVFLLLLLLVIVYYIYPEIFDPLGQIMEEHFLYPGIKASCLSINEDMKRIGDGSVKTIVVPYIGSLEGTMSEKWLEEVDSHFIKFHLENEIPAVFSFYASDLDGNKKFDRILKELYLSNCFEILQKGTDKPENDPFLYKMPFETQKKGIEQGKKNLEGKLKRLLPDYDIAPMSLFNSLEGKVNEDTIRALDELGFKAYFELFHEEGVEFFKPPSPRFDVYQYGVSFTKAGLPGPGAEFWKAGEIIREIENFALNNSETPLTRVDNITVIPIFMENWDIEGVDSANPGGNSEINTTKWEIYKQVLLTLNSRNDTIILTPLQVWELRHRYGHLPANSLEVRNFVYVENSSSL